MKEFKKQIAGIKTENDLKSAHIAICQAYSAYRLSHEQFTGLLSLLRAKRAEKVFAWGKSI